VTARALAVRRRGLGPYRPLPDGGDHVLAFRRGESVAVVVPRLPMRLARTGGWADRTIALPPGDWHHELAGTSVPGGELALGELFGQFPVALLTTGRRP
jgi:(1->4)-alpha-D-glucan 1-alpha-D-glucosylmutase